MVVCLAGERHRAVLDGFVAERADPRHAGQFAALAEHLDAAVVVRRSDSGLLFVTVAPTPATPVVDRARTPSRERGSPPAPNSYLFSRYTQT